jgi:hypothetical protein
MHKKIIGTNLFFAAVLLAGLIWTSAIDTKDPNKYKEKFSAYFLIALGGLGFVVSGYFVARYVIG